MSQRINSGCLRKYMVFLTMNVLTSNALASENAVAFRCEANSPEMNAVVTIDSLGAAQVLVRGPSTGEHLCVLRMGFFRDLRQGITPIISIALKREKSCQPRLVEPLLTQLDHAIDLTISFLDSENPVASVFLMRHQEALPCKINKLRMIDLETIGRRSRGKTQWNFTGIQPEEPTPSSKPKPKSKINGQDIKSRGVSSE
jgi:hypothetical protein